jgi:hypothetical protein
VTLGPCPGLADRCPRHKTNSSNAHGALAGSPSVGLGSMFGMGVPPNRHRHPDNGVNTRNSAIRVLLYPEGRLGTWEAGSGLGSRSRGRMKETPGHCSHLDSRASQVQIAG